MKQLKIVQTKWIQKQFKIVYKNMFAINPRSLLFFFMVYFSEDFTTDKTIL